MPVHSKKITDSVARALDVPEAGYTIHWCPDTPGFGLRITASGARSWIAERRVEGKTVRRTLGSAEGRSAISAAAARALQVDISSELQRGTDRLETRKAARAAEKIEALTLEDAVKDYARTKRRTKDGLPLKQRTKDDYLGMVVPGGTTKSGSPTLPGALHSLAAKPLHRITGEMIRRLYRELEPRGERRRAYALQVLRAVLRHHGVAVEDDPFSASTAGAARVRLPGPKGNPTRIPPELLGAWWRAACDMRSVGADQLRFMLLTGARPGEAAAIKVKDFDLLGRRIRLHDTKNRSDFDLVLSEQAATIANWYALDGKPNDLLFGVADAGKSLQKINAAAGVIGVSPHKLRHTFASIAADLVPAFTLRRMLNHAGGGDTAGEHYVHVSEAQLRGGWQRVADFVEEQAGRPGRVER